MKKKEKIQLVLIVIIVLITGVFLLLQNRSGEEDGRIWIARPDGGTKKQSVSLAVEEAEKNLTLEVGARVPTKEETETVLAETLRMLHEMFRIQEGATIVTEQSLVLPQYSPETGANIRWDSTDEEVLAKDGTLRREHLTGPAEVTLRAYISYGEETREHWFPVTVLPYEEGSTEAMFYRAGQELIRLEQETAGEKGFYLPEEIGGVTVEMSKDKVSLPGLLAAVVLFLPIAILLAKRQEREKERKKREDEWLAEYPRLITKLTLYTGAGLSLRGAWERLASEYRERAKNRGKKDAVSEEIFTLAGELKNGTAEARAYEAFGRRIGLKPYLRCASLLVSQLQKGSGALREGLETEVRLAWEMQRERAAKKGEEAQTKMLFPMMGMLFLVMAVVIIPAFFSM